MTRTICTGLLALTLAGCAAALPADKIASASNQDLATAWHKARRGVALVGLDVPRERYVQLLREEAIRRNRQWPEEEAEAVRRGAIFQGMTEGQVYWSIGPPFVVQRSNDPGGRRVVWEYINAYITFHDGHVVWWHVDD